MEISQSTGNPGRVLIVDDDRFFRSLIANLLQQYSYRCIEAANGTVAVEMMRSNPSVVIVDFRLPDCDGLSLIGRLKEINPDTPIIFLSGMRCDAGRLARLRAYNVAAVLEKPVDPANFINVVQDVLRQYKPVEVVPEQTHQEMEAQLPALEFDRFEHEEAQPKALIAQDSYNTQSYPECHNHQPRMLAITQDDYPHDSAYQTQTAYYETPYDTLETADAQPEYVDSEHVEPFGYEPNDFDQSSSNEDQSAAPAATAQADHQQQDTTSQHDTTPQDDRYQLDAEELKNIAESLAVFQREYLAALPNDLISLSNRINEPAADMEEIRRAAHTLKGTSGSYGIIEISHLAKRIEDIARKDEPKELKAMSGALLHAAEDLRLSSSLRVLRNQMTQALNHVVVIHGHTGFRERLRSIATQVDVDCTAVEDVMEAISCVKNRDVDAFIFGPAPGLETSVTELKTHMESSGKHSLIVLATGHATMTDRIAAVNQGFDLIVDGVFTERSLGSISQKVFPPIPRTVLIIDDDTRNADSIARALTKAGTRVLLESDPSKLAFDTITQDVQVVLVARELKSFKGGDGFDVCRALLSCKEATSLSVVLMDDEFDPRARRQAMAIGCDDYLFPPMTSKTLVHRISRLASHGYNAQQLANNNHKPAKPKEPSRRERLNLFKIRPMVPLEKLS